MNWWWGKRGVSLSEEEIEKKIASDRPLAHRDVAPALDCVLRRLDHTLGAGDTQVTAAAKRLSDESQRTQRMSVVERTCVLFVDDELMALATVKFAFESLIDVLVANSGEEALRLLHEEHERVDLIVSDQRMPDMAGDALLGRCYCLWPHIPRVLMSAYHDMDSLRRAVNIGLISATISKPFDNDEMLSTIKRVVGRPVVQRSSRPAALAHLTEEA